MKKAELGKIKSISVFASLLLVVCNYFVHAQHGVGPAWGPAVALPKFNSGAKQRGTLYNNQVATSGGRIIISTSEHNPSNLNMVYGYYLTYSDDGGQTWLNPPIKFTPINMVVGGSSLKLAIDKNNTIYALWLSSNPAAMYISKLDTNLNVIVDTIRVASKINYGFSSPHITIDRYNRIHVMWNDGKTSSSQTAEVYYSRSTNNGLTWQPALLLSNNDGKHSAFPHAQFDLAGDTIAIPWRDSVSGSNWDVEISFSTNGGLTWTNPPSTILTGPDAQWDPDLIIDTYNRIHLFYTVYPAGNPLYGARNYYQYTDDVGTTWNLPNNPSNGMISDNYRSHLIAGTSYDPVNGVLYTTWKDERDFNTSNGEVRGDIMINYSLDRGLTWSGPEFATDLYDSTAGYKSASLLPNGALFINYECVYPDDIYDPSGKLNVFFKKRNPIITSINNNSNYNNYNIQFYPNPFSIQTTLVLNKNLSNAVIAMYDFLGRTVMETKNISGQTITINRNNLPKGVYLVNIIQNDHIVGTKKILITD